MPPYAAVNGAARALAALGFLWIVAWACVGGTAAGKAWYARLAAALVSSRDPKGGLPVLVLAAPILLPATLAQLLATREPEAAAPRRCPGALAGLRRGGRWLTTRVAGDVNFASASLAVVVPCALYAFGSIRRHLREDPDGTRDTRLADAANALGMAALAALPLSLPVVARGSVLLRLAGWSPVHAARLHGWVGRAVVLGAALHGGLHLARWTLAGESLLAVLVPPRSCWTGAGPKPTCRTGATECSCRDLLRNLTGLLAVAGLLLMAVSSLEVVRRGAYAIFYRIHIVAGPLVVVAIAVHYGRAMLYLVGGLVFYMASSFPVRVETFLRRQHPQQKVRIVQIQPIAASDTAGLHSSPVEAAATAPASSVALTVEATDSAMARFRACQYVRLRAPTVSALSHPFSINLVPEESQQLRIVFRVSGPFTTRLASYLTTHPAPELYLDGFYGPSHRIQQTLRHDTVVLVAGGIGITAYLSLLQRLPTIASQSVNGVRLRRIVLHWMCRDTSLIRYIHQEYLEPLRGVATGSALALEIKVFLYITSNANESKWSLSDSRDLEKPPDNLQPQVYHNELSNRTDSSPFAPTYFEPVSRLSFQANLLHFAVFSLMSIAGVYLVWTCYTLVSRSDDVSGRIWAPLALVTAELAIAFMGALAARRFIRDAESEEFPEWTQLSTSAEDSLELAASKADGLSVTEDHDNKIVIPQGRGEASVVIEERLGRPSIHQLVNVFDSAHYPALFVCGPESLLIQVRQVVQDRCLARSRQCIRGGAKIALYEESFQT